jgi:hypothetical protein
VGKRLGDRRFHWRCIQELMPLLHASRIEELVTMIEAHERERE